MCHSRFADDPDVTRSLHPRGRAFLADLLLLGTCNSDLFFTSITIEGAKPGRVAPCSPLIVLMSAISRAKFKGARPAAHRRYGRQKGTAHRLSGLLGKQV
jgi:hypothetical protein